VVQLGMVGLVGDGESGMAQMGMGWLRWGWVAPLGMGMTQLGMGRSLGDVVAHIVEDLLS
jgi:hypothetical protein